MTLLIRPDDWNLPLFVHVAGAMVLLGALLLAAVVLAGVGRAGEPTQVVTLTRFGFRTLLAAALPAFVVMRVGAEWIASEEDLDDEPWIGVGYITSDGGLVFLVAAIIVAGLSLRRARKGGRPASLARAAAILSFVIIAAFLVAVWAMTTKPD